MTRVSFLDLSRHVAAMREELDAAIAEVLGSGRFVGGEPVERFEQEFARYCGAAHAVGVASGTDAITLALQAVGVGRGDEVITVANTCVPTVAGIERSGAVPVIVDPSSETMTMDAAHVEEALGPKTRALVPVHLYGRCVDMDPILELARRHDLKIVEDCAQAHGATLGGRPAGTFGDVAAFSFYPTKNLGALGDGGAVVTSHDEFADHARLLRSYGEAQRYESVITGMNSRLDTLQAALLSVQLRHLDAWTGRRRTIAREYTAALGETELVVPGDDVGHAYHLYVVRSSERDAFRQRLFALGVETLVHYPRAVHQHPAYAEIRRGDALQVSEQLANEVVSLPLYPELTDGEVQAVVTAVRSAV